MHGKRIAHYHVASSTIAKRFHLMQTLFKVQTQLKNIKKYKFALSASHFVLFLVIFYVFEVQLSSTALIQMAGEDVNTNTSIHSALRNILRVVFDSISSVSNDANFTIWKRQLQILIQF